MNSKSDIDSLKIPSGCWVTIFIIVAIISFATGSTGGIIIGAIIVLALILYYNDSLKEKNQEAERIKLKQKQDKKDALVAEELSVKLRKQITKRYALKECPRCAETQMKLVKISPKARSIELQCVYCSKQITSKILSGKGTGKITDILDQIWDKDLREETVFDLVILNIEQWENPDEKKRRKPIPESVKHEVWRRDNGKCVQCGSNENIEFDHVIPFSKGGADTARNLQLLCQSCNREKKDKI
jgi:5-methylcytosine-specific restriction endonuclease McrA